MNGVVAVTPRQKSSGWLPVLARWSLALLILAVLIYFLPVAQLRNALSAIPLTRFAALLALYLVALTLGVAKWHLVVNASDAGLPLSVSAQCYAGGLFGALFLPSIVGGDAVRLAVGLAHSPRPAAVVLGNLVDRFLDAAAQLTLVFVGLTLLSGSLPSALKAQTRHLLFVAAIVGLFLTAALAMLLRFLRGRSVRVRRVLAQLRSAYEAASKRPYRILASFLLGISVQGIFLGTTLLLGVSCGLHLPVQDWLFAWPLSKIAGILPITQGGIGVRETVMVALLVPFGAPAALVVATGIASEGIVIAGGLIAGLVAFLLRRRASRHRLV